MGEIIDRRISFNGGELSPWLDPRIDLDKYRAGCRTLKNMLPAIYGGAIRRPGTAYLGAAATASGKVRLVPFVASASTAYVLEFSALKLRIWTTGATPALVGAPLVIVTPYVEADLNSLQFAQQNDVLFIAHANYAPRELSRYSATDWRLGDLQVFWPATSAENISDTTLTVAVSNGVGTTWSSATSYTTLGTKVLSGGKVWALKEACLNVTPGTGVLAQRHWLETVEWSATAWASGPTYYLGAACFYSGQVWASLQASNTNHIPAGGVGDLWWKAVPVSAGLNVTLTASAALFASTDVGSKWVLSQKREDLKVDLFATTVAGTLSAAIQVLGEWSASVTAAAPGSNDWEVNWIIQRSFDNINWETRNVIACRYGDVQKLITGNETIPCFLRVKQGSGTPYYAPASLKCSIEAGDPTSPAIYQITGYTSATVVTAMILFPSEVLTATKYWNAGAWSAANGYPRAVTLHQARLFFGGTAMKPTTFWGSAVDGYEDFRVDAAEDSAVAYTLNSDEASAVEWLVSQEMLLIGTASGEWVFGSRAGETAEKLRRNTSYGSLPVQARTIADALVFIQRSGRKLREFAWSFERDGYQSTDLSMLAEHVGDSVFLQIAIQRNPDPIIWVVTAAGELLALTYERAQKVAAWSRHTTDGLFESVAVVPGTGEDEQVWVAVQRSGVRLIERLTPDVVRSLKSGATTTLVYADCSKTSVSSGSGLVSGLSHLIGKSVSLLVDGKVHAPVTVSGGGTVQLVATAANYNKNVVAGLPYDSILEPTYLETMDPNSVSLAGKKRLHRAVLEFWKSGAPTVSTDGGVTFTPVTFDSGVTLMTGPLEMYLDGSSGRQITAIFKQSAPLPFNLMGLMLRYNVEMG